MLPLRKWIWFLSLFKFCKQTFYVLVPCQSLLSVILWLVIRNTFLVFDSIPGTALLKPLEIVKDLVILNSERNNGVLMFLTPFHQFSGGNFSSRKIRDTKGTFHAKMGTIKDRNDMDLTEAEDINKRWQEYTKNYTKKILMTQITMKVCSFT